MIPAGIEANFQISGSRMNAFAACNNLAGDVTVRSDGFTLSDRTVTRRACPPPQRPFFDAIEAVLVSGSYTATIDGSSLRLDGPSGTLRLREG